MVIVAAVDESSRADEVMQQAASIADAFNEPIHVVHVLSRSEFVSLERTSVDKTGTGLDMDEIRSVAADVAAEAAADLEDPHEAVGLVGSPADRIVEYADDQDARYIVLAGRKRSPTGKMIFGSVAHPILMNATCPVVMSVEH